MHRVPTRGIRQTHHEYENHERRGNEPIVVAHIVNILVIQDTVGQIHFLNELRVEIARNHRNARFQVHDVSDGRVRRAKRLNERNGSRSNKENIRNIKRHTNGAE